MSTLWDGYAAHWMICRQCRDSDRMCLIGRGLWCAAMTADMRQEKPDERSAP